MATVQDILNCKGELVYSLSPQETILDALKLMKEKDIGAVLIMEDKKVLGIFSERDYARRGTIIGNPVSTPLKNVMTQVVYYVNPEQSLETCLAQMSDKNIRHLPVLRGDKAISVISIGDVVTFLIVDQKELIVGLENFILGREIEL